MKENHIVFKIIYARLGAHCNVGISHNSDITLLVTHPDFISAIRKMDFNKKQLLGLRQYERTKSETHILNCIVDCMRECQFFKKSGSISLVHPESDNKILFKIK